MNFIRHYRATMDHFATDGRITALHLALYQGLFYFWNLARFPESLPIARDDIMKYGHIGSVKTYTKTIKDLDAWGYLSYRPSIDPRYRTAVCLYRFDQGGAQGIDKGRDHGPDHGTEQGIDQGPAHGGVQPLLNSIINDTNELNDKNELNSLNDYGTVNENSNCFNGWEQPDPVEAHTGDHSKRKSDDGGGGAPGSLEEVKAYFAAQKYPSREAEKFYSYFGSVGWTVGKSQRPMRDWQLGANNWMLHAKQIDDEHPVKPGDLRVPKDRDYQQPL